MRLYTVKFMLLQPQRLLIKNLRQADLLSSGIEMKNRHHRHRPHMFIFKNIHPDTMRCTEFNTIIPYFKFSLS